MGRNLECLTCALENMAVERLTENAAAEGGNTRAEVVSYLVRVGLHGQVGRFRPSDGDRLDRKDRVLCRTGRGLEVGQVLAQSATDGGQVDGWLVRKMQPEDELLWANLVQLSQAAHSKCMHWLSERGLPDLLLDVEPLMDGKTLYFHFLSDVSSEVQNELDQLASLYEREVLQSEFAAQLEHGCGEGCGTDKAARGCGSSGGCAVCKVADLCKKP